jgi:quercetin dioxygenase-like cupin family protein
MSRARRQGVANSKARKSDQRRRSKARILQDTISSRAQKKAALQYLPWNEVPLETMNPLLQRQLIVGHQVMLARVLLKKGCIVPLHRHPNEQLSYILEGALKFLIEGQEIVLRAGEVLAIPPNLPHQAEALEDTVDLDIFHPPRADWINKTDGYLRK